MVCYRVHRKDQLTVDVKIFNDNVQDQVIAGLILAALGAIWAAIKFKWWQRISARWAIKLTKINCYTSFVANIGYPLKYYVEMRNDSSKCIEVRLLNYISNKITAKPLPPEVMQIRFYTKWFPTDLSADRVAVLPGQMCRIWIGLDDKKFTEAQVKDAEGRMGRLVMSANKKEIPFEL
jgi:hypothetical protein